METMLRLTIEAAKAIWHKAYPRGVELAYVDRNDSLNDHLDLLQEVVEQGYSQTYDEDKSFEWFNDQEHEAKEEYKKEVFGEYDIEAIEDHVDEMIRDANTGDPFKDLMRNTHTQVFFYNLGYEAAGYPENNAKEAKKIAKVLKIDFKQHEKTLVELTANAGYGGNLCLLFSADVDWFYGNMAEDKKYVTIKGASVCVMDRWNGSGHSVTGLGDFKVRMDRTRFKLDEEASGYSFAQDVCGMTVDEAVLIETNEIKGVIGSKAE